MDIFEVIRERRSVRKFKEEDIPDKLVRTILDAARRAPSAGNFQPWLFIIIRDDQLKEKSRAFLGNRALRYAESDEGKRELEKHGHDERSRWIEAVRSGRFQAHMNKAPVLIAVFGDTKSPYYIHDCCAATENLILAAQGLGLGSCWIDPGFGDDLTESQFRRLLKVPRNYRIVSLVAIGFSADTSKPRPRKDIDKIAFLNEYGRRWVSKQPLSAGQA
jgi:nitroreductase